VHRAFGVSFVSFLVAFAVVASGITWASALARAFAGDCLSAFVDVPVILTALALIGLIAALNLRGIEESVKLLGSLADTTVALLVIVFAIVNVGVLVLRRDPVEHEHFVVPLFVPVVGVGVSLALLTQVEAATYGRAALLVLLGVALWGVNWLILRRGTTATAPPSS
jgi:amino acid transporter